MELGSTFLLKDPSVDRHLWIVLSSPGADPKKVLLVSVTTWRTGKDSTCMIQRGEHPFVTHASCISYLDARDATLQQLFALKDAGLLEVREPLSQDLLRKVLEGAGESKFLPVKYKQMLTDQGLL